MSEVLCKTVTPSSAVSVLSFETRTLVKSSSSYSSSFISIAAKVFAEAKASSCVSSVIVLFFEVSALSLLFCLLFDEQPKIDVMVNVKITETANNFFFMTITLPFYIHTVFCELLSNILHKNVTAV